MESGEQENDLVRERRERLSFVLFLLFYTGGLAYGLLGGWQSSWLRPETAMMVGLTMGLSREPHLVDALRRRRWLSAALPFLAYFVPMVAIYEYRWLDRFPPAMRDRVPSSLLPWDPRITLGIGIVVYVVLIVRAIWLLSKRRGLIGGDARGQAN